MTVPGHFSLSLFSLAIFTNTLFSKVQLFPKPFSLAIFPNTHFPKVQLFPKPFSQYYFSYGTMKFKLLLHVSLEVSIETTV
ncbi:hypothetical protein C0J52_15438 [Blattella germanica]|nr:hypothetical protein C0J52_15438 [Blattella germanica]